MSVFHIGLQVLFLSLLCVGHARRRGHRPVNHAYHFGRPEPLPDLDFPDGIMGLEGLKDISGGPKSGPGLKFKPPGTVEGLMMGDVLRRIENLEALCQMYSDAGTPRPTPRTLNTDKVDGLHLDLRSHDATPGPPNHIMVPGPEAEKRGPGPSPQQLQKSVDIIQDSVLLVATEQDKLREEFADILSEIKAAKQELRDVLSGQRDLKAEMTSAVQKADLNLQLQGRRLESLSANVTNIDSSLSAFHNSFHDLSHLNRSLLVARKEQRHTSRRITNLGIDLKVVRRDVTHLQENWNKTMKETSRRLERSYTVGKDVNRLQKQFHSMKSKVTRINGMRCESGRVMFMNYPFSFTKWPQTRKVKFHQSFPQRPQVTYGLTQLDVNFRYNTRARVRLVKLTNETVTFACDSWYDTRLYRVEISWMACTV